MSREGKCERRQEETRGEKKEKVKRERDKRKERQGLAVTWSTFGKNVRII